MRGNLSHKQKAYRFRGVFMNAISKAKALLTTTIITPAIWVLLSVSPAHAQSQLEVTVQQFSADEVKGYVQPLGDMFGANMNAGLYHSAAMPTDGFHLRIDIIGMVSMVRDEHRMYDASLPAGFVPNGGSYKTATVFGGRGTTFKDVNSGLEYKGSDGIFSTNIFPLLVPQATIGTFLGTEASIRYISTPPLSGGKLPNSTLWGVGVRHSLSRYFGNKPPIDASLGAFFSSFTVGELLDFRGMALNLQVSKTLLLFTFYGGFAYENSSMMLHYTYKAGQLNAPQTVDLQLDGGNNFRYTAGLELDLQAIRVYADANFGYVQHFSGGIGFGF